MLNRFLTTKEQLVLLGVALAFGIGGVATYFAKSDDPDPERVPLHTASNARYVQQNASPIPDSELEPPEVPVPTVPAPRPTVPRTIEAITPAGQVAVSVVGAVSRPGLYRLDGGSRVNDAIEAAGGLLESADTSNINLAAALIDGTTLTIPPSGHERRTDGNRLVLRSASVYAPNPPQYTISGWHSGAAGSNRDESPAASPLAAARPAAAGLIDLNSASAEELQTLPGIGPKLAEEIVRYRSATPFQSVHDLLNVHGIGPKRFEGVEPLVTVGGV